MLVSWNWLSRYLDLTMSAEELAERLSLSGLNHEETRSVDGDVVIDLEVTSNRGDCLGHLGVAREIGVLYDLPVRGPDPHPPTSKTPVADRVRVTNRFPEACSRYTARVLHGIEVGKSPPWLVDSLRSIGIASINNVVDVTNYVMMECGQPLHVFDLAHLEGAEIVVRPGAEGETIEAIDHRTYALDGSTCVIADRQKAVAIAGVMGGAHTEVTDQTRDLLIEAAVFAPLSVRRTARRLKLHSPSSFRFERRVDPAGVDWASRRTAELILEIAGGELSSGVVDTAPQVASRPPVALRLSQIRRLLGIEIERDRVLAILTALGCTPQGKDAADSLKLVPPSWRHDLTREVDLIEEVARVHGYDRIPEDSPVPVAPSRRRPFDTAVDCLRHVLTAAGISEAMTPSIVTEPLDGMLSPWTDRPALATETPMLEGARRLRRTLIPSLLQSRAANFAGAGDHADLFEIAHIYLPGERGEDLPAEQYSVALVIGGDFFAAKGIVEQIVQRLGIQQPLSVRPVTLPGFDGDLMVEVWIGEQCAGLVGTIDAETTRRLKLPAAPSVAELSLPAMFAVAQLVPQFTPISPYPSISRDLNLIVDEAVRWADLEATVRRSVPEGLTAVRYRETYRDPQRDGAARKRLLLSVEFQRSDATLTGAEADAMCTAILENCAQEHGAVLVA